MPERFDEQLLDHIENRRNEEALAMLNKELAQQFVDSDPHGTLLHHAVYNNNVVIAQKLIELGADVNCNKAHCRTPLSIALKNERDNIVRVLLEADARVDIVNDDGSSALTFGLDPTRIDSKARELVISKLRKLASTNEELTEILIKTGCNMYHAAAFKDLDLMDCMLRRGVDVNSKGPNGTTALHVFAGLNDVRMANWLLKKGADVNALEDGGSSALSSSAQMGYKDMMQLLLEHGANPNVGGDGVWIIFPSWMMRRIYGFENSEDVTECVELLLQYGTNLPDSKEFMEIIKLALFYSSFEVIKMFIAHLAMLEMLGKPVDKTITRVTIDEYKEKMTKLQEYYEPCKRVLAIEVFEKLTLLDLLNKSDDEMRILIGNERFLREVKRFSSEHRLSMLYPYYYNTMMWRIEKASRVVK